MFEALVEPEGFSIFTSSDHDGPNLQIYLSNGEGIIEAADDLDCEDNLRGFTTSGHATPGEALQTIAAKLATEEPFVRHAQFLKDNRVISGIRF